MSHLHLIHGLCAVGATEDLIGFLRLHDRVPTYNDTGDLAGQLDSVLRGHQVATEESEEKF